MGDGRGDSFPFDFETNGNPFGSKSKGKLSPRPSPIQFERKLNTSFLSVGAIKHNKQKTIKTNKQIRNGGKHIYINIHIYIYMYLYIYIQIYRCYISL